MTIETKYNVGDEVWIERDTKAVQVTVQSIETYHQAGESIIRYSVVLGSSVFQRDEHEVHTNAVGVVHAASVRYDAILSGMMLTGVALVNDHALVQ